MARRNRKHDSTDIIASIIVHGLGAAALLCGLYVLWWGEDQTARYSSLSSKALQSAAEVADISRIDPALEGKLVHASGRPEIKAPLEDPLLGIRLSAFTLDRSVSCYQVTEEKIKKNSEGRIEVSYEYRDRWMRGPVSPAGFNSSYQKRRAKMPRVSIKSLSLTAQDATLGAYRLPRFLIESLHNPQPVRLSLSEEKRNELLKTLGISSGMLHVTENGLYIGADPSTPHIGDVRIRLSQTPVTDVSLLTQVKGDTFERWRNPGDPENVNIGQMMPGTVMISDMVGKVDSDVSGGSWLVRGLAALLAAAGMIFMPWDWLMQFAPVRLLMKGRSSEGKDWEIGPVFRICLALMLLVAGAAWLLNGYAAAGGTLLASGAALLLLRIIVPGKRDSRAS